MKTDTYAARAADAAAKLDWFHGKRETHPHGQSGRDWIIPYEWNRKLNDGGEWAFYAGMENWN